MSHRRRFAAASSALAVVTLLAAGCSKSDDGDKASTTGDTKTSSASTGDAVEIKDFLFNPKDLTVKAGTKVTFTNEDGNDHTATSTDGPASFDSKDLGKGKTFSFTFEKAGTYRYQCDIHNYMKGTLTVR